MFKYMTAMGIIIILLAIVTVASAEKATELFIPIGKSPGLSGKYLVTGRIEQVNAQNKTISMSGEAGEYTVRISDQTMIFLDKSKMKQANQYGNFSDFKKGTVVEVRFEKDERGQPAEWVKIQMSQ
jgi:hypothetical protein